MRIKLKLNILNSKFFPFNYNYYFSSLIYSILRSSSEEYAAKLHDEGFNLDGKRYKLFTFAFRQENGIANSNYIELNSPSAELFISSPLVENFMSYFISGILKIKNALINITHSNICCKIDKIEILNDININTETNFRLLSPLVLSTRKKINGKLCTYYLRYNDNETEINRILTTNLSNKYKIIYNKSPEGNVRLLWDTNYINRRLSENKRLSTKTTINPTKNGIDIIGINVPFKLIGNPELIKTGYECGFGEKNSMGFGMAEVI